MGLIGSNPKMANEEDPAYYEALGRAVKVLRTERGLERRDLADLADISYPYLSEIENGKKRPSSRALLQIANALGVPASALLETTEAYVGTVPPARDRTAPAPPPAFAAATPPPPTSASPRRWFRVDRATASEQPAGEVREPIADDERLTLIRQLLDTSAQLQPDDLRRLLDLAWRLRV
jgi:transcriptional regulator with XRE-family HTH domain